MKVAIIGSEGYIGSKLSPMFSDVTNYDLCWYGKHNKNVIKKDYNDIGVDELEAFDAVVLLAGHSSVKMCVGDWRSTFNNNVRNFTSLIDKISKTNKPIKFIYASSCSVYGNTFGNIANETFNTNIQMNEYDTSKNIIDDIAGMYTNVEWYGLRFATVNGFSPNLRKDLMINSMLFNAKFSDQIMVSNKDIYRGILGIDDLCNGINCIVENGKKEYSGVYNFVSFNSSVDTIAGKVAERTGADINYLPDAKNPYSFRVSADRFEQTFNFKFKQNIDNLIDDISDNSNGIQTILQRNSMVTYD